MQSNSAKHAVAMDSIAFLLRALRYPSPDGCDVGDPAQFRALLVWLENTKIRQYPIDGRKQLQSTDPGAWQGALAKYLADLECPVPPADRGGVARWLLTHAVGLEYQDQAQQLGEVCAAAEAAAPPPEAWTEREQPPLPDACSEGVQAQMRQLLGLLQVPADQVGGAGRAAPQAGRVPNDAQCQAWAVWRSALRGRTAARSRFLLNSSWCLQLQLHWICRLLQIQYDRQGHACHRLIPSSTPTPVRLAGPPCCAAAVAGCPGAAGAAGAGGDGKALLRGRSRRVGGAACATCVLLRSLHASLRNAQKLPRPPADLCAPIPPKQAAGSQQRRRQRSPLPPRRCGSTRLALPRATRAQTWPPPSCACCTSRTCARCRRWWTAQ